MELYRDDARYIDITAFYALSLCGYNMHAHSHKSCEIMYVTKGECQIYADQTECVLREHQFILLDTGTPHRLWIPEGHTCSLLNLEFCVSSTAEDIRIEELVKNSEGFRKLCHQGGSYLIASDSTNLGYAMKDLITHLERKAVRTADTSLEFSKIKVREVRQRRFNITEQEYQYLTQLLFQRVILELCSCVVDNKNSAGVLYVKKACDYIQMHLTEEIRVPKLAAYTGVNKSYLQQLFSNQMQCTITEYINRKRLEHSEFLLVNSSLSITDIAFHSGYNSRQHYGRSFERVYEMSPRAYRELHQKSIQSSTGEKRFQRTEDGSWEDGPV